LHDIGYDVYITWFPFAGRKRYEPCDEEVIAKGVAVGKLGAYIKKAEERIRDRAGDANWKEEAVVGHIDVMSH
jgi:hypothetical protein